jgi:hypothetical protein
MQASGISGYVLVPVKNISGFAGRNDKRVATGKRCSLGLDIVLHYSTFATQFLKRVCATFNALIPLGTLQILPLLQTRGLMRLDADDQTDPQSAFRAR